MLFLTVQGSNCHVWVSLDLEKTAIAAELLLQNTEEHLARGEAWALQVAVRSLGWWLRCDSAANGGLEHSSRVLDDYRTVGLCPVASMHRNEKTSTHHKVNSRRRSPRVIDDVARIAS